LHFVVAPERRLATWVRTPTDATGRHLATRAIIVNPEKRRGAQNLSLLAAVLLIRGIAQINK